MVSTVSLWSWFEYVSWEVGGAEMARHRLTLRERLRGVELAAKSRHTPKRLVPGLKAYARRLRKELNRTA